MKNADGSNQGETRPTARRITFDLIAGIIAPLLCLFIDPFVFRSGFDLGDFSGGYLGEYALGAYSAFLIAMLAMCIWLLGNKFPQWAYGVMAGILASGAIWAFVVGASLLPLSVIGVFVLGIGLLGFIPFLTAFSYSRSAARAFRISRDAKGLRFTSVVCGLGLMLALGIPIATHLGPSRVFFRAVEQVLTGTPQSAKDAIELLKRYGPWTGKHSQRILFAYEAEKDESRKEYFASAYKDITRKDAKETLERVRD